MALVWAPYTPLPSSSLPHHPLWGPDSREFLSKSFSERNWKEQPHIQKGLGFACRSWDNTQTAHIPWCPSRCALIHCPKTSQWLTVASGACFSSLAVFCLMDAGYLQCLGERRKSDWQRVYICLVRVHTLLRSMRGIWDHVLEFSRSVFFKS